MSWDLTIRANDNDSLGSPEHVRDSITKEFLFTEWELSSGGDDLVAQMQLYGADLSDEMLSMLRMTPPCWRGVYDTPQTTVEFSLNAEASITWVNVSSRGDHSETQRKLRAIAVRNNWWLDGDCAEVIS